MSFFSRMLATLWLALLLNAPQAVGLDAPSLHGPSTSDTGYAQLSWSHPAASRVAFELQVSPDPNFTLSRTLYSGTQTGSFVSGLENGTLHYRVRAKKDGSLSPWSETKKLSVRHFDARFAWILFVTGAAILLAIIAVILRGAPHAIDPTSHLG